MRNPNLKVLLESCRHFIQNLFACNTLNLNCVLYPSSHGYWGWINKYKKVVLHIYFTSSWTQSSTMKRVSNLVIGTFQSGISSNGIIPVDRQLSKSAQMKGRTECKLLTTVKMGFLVMVGSFCLAHVTALYRQDGMCTQKHQFVLTLPI